MQASSFAQAKKSLLELHAQPIAAVANEEYFLLPEENLLKVAQALSKDHTPRLVTMIACDEGENASFGLYYIFSYPQEDKFLGIKILIPKENPTFTSITPIIHAAHWYEREAQDLFGLQALGHPDPRPLIKHENYTFARVEGEGVFEVPVGPIHAGIIEPGHFRFSVLGEKILNLEARLFYTHRGLEKLCEGKDIHEALLIAERTCGVCAFSHALSFCTAIERISETSVPLRAQYLRTIMLELERLYNHIGDISNICAGTGFHFGISQMAVLKEKMQSLNEELTGNRFLRGYCIPGGVKYDLDAQDIQKITQVIKGVEHTYNEVITIILGHEFFLSRMSETGILKQQDALNLGAVGPAARASGIKRDVRYDHDQLVYKSLGFEPVTFSNGDVESRFKVRAGEIEVSFKLVKQCLKEMPNGPVNVSLGKVPQGFALGFSESPRGDNYHWVKTNQEGKIERLRIRSASYCNWPAVAVSVPGNMIPDFPLINKSFELCYSCCDR